MKKKIGIKLAVPPHSLIQSVRRSACIFAMTAFALIGFSRAAHAVTPAPDGGYSGQNTAEGTNALFTLGAGTNNTALGFQAAYADWKGSSNTAVGWNALRFNGIGNDNIAVGAQALYKCDGCDFNTAVGRNALLLNTGPGSTAVGYQALQSNTLGYNTAVGYQAALNHVGPSLCAFGFQALYGNTTGEANNAHGSQALYSNTTGSSNNAFGRSALFFNSTGYYNSAFGDSALYESTGIGNTAIGLNAGHFLVTGDNNVYVGSGVNGVDGENNATHIRNIGSTPIVGGTSVVIAGTGGIGDQVLGYASSSRRYKQDIEPMAESSAALFALKPVTFRPNDGNSPSELKLYGLIAEDVEKVSRDLVAYNQRGEVTTVRYDAVNAMLLNEFQKEHRKVEELGETIAELRSTIAQQAKGTEALAAQVKEQSAQIQRVSAELAASTARPQVADKR
jgi:hypothetical protein